MTPASSHGCERNNGILSYLNGVSNLCNNLTKCLNFRSYACCIRNAMRSRGKVPRTVATLNYPQIDGFQKHDPFVRTRSTEPGHYLPTILLHRIILPTRKRNDLINIGRCQSDTRDGFDTREIRKFQLIRLIYNIYETMKSFV